MLVIKESRSPIISKSRADEAKNTGVGTDVIGNLRYLDESAVLFKTVPRKARKPNVGSKKYRPIGIYVLFSST